MSNFGIKIDLLKLKGAAVTELQTPTGVKRCLVIPVDDNNIFVGQKGCYLDLVAFEMRNPKYESTHTLKQSLPKAVRDAMSEQERNAQPILGDLRPLGGNAPSQPAYGTDMGGGGYGYPQQGGGFPAPPPAYGGGGYSAPANKEGDPF